MRFAHLSALAAVLWALPLFAQTYTPKAIKLQGADGMDQAELMRLVDLPAGAPVSKDQIEAAIHRLGDSGLFSEIRYSVGPDALIFIMKPAPGTQALPVRFSNFVWWKPGELEPLVEARVPLFRGKLPLTGPVTDQVEAALVALLADKGIQNAQVTARLSSLGENAIALSIEQPQIMLRKIQLTGTAPEVASRMDQVLADVSAEEFDTLLSAKAIVDNTADTHRNAGFLDVVVKDPFFSEPYLETVGYGVDASAMVYPGARYRVSAISFEGLPPGLETEVAKTSGIRAGDPAGAMTLRIAEGSAARVLENRGMLEASASAAVTKDGSAHTVAYRIQVVPGPVYSFAGVDFAGLSAAQQLLFLRSFHIKPGVIADQTVHAEIITGLRAAGATGARIDERRNRATHKVTYVLESSSQGAKSAG